MLKMAFDSEKALEALLYIANHCPIKDIYHVLKIQFFADRKHLERVGRFITGDHYIAMKNGPVASNAYNFLKVARGEQVYIPEPMAEKIRSTMTIQENIITQAREANLDYLSQSDVDCLDEAIAENGKLTFTELNNKSHDDLWKSADLNDEILFADFIKYSENSEQLQDYLNG